MPAKYNAVGKAAGEGLRAQKERLAVAAAIGCTQIHIAIERQSILHNKVIPTGLRGINITVDRQPVEVSTRRRNDNVIAASRLRNNAAANGAAQQIEITVAGRQRQRGARIVQGAYEIDG